MANTLTTLQWAPVYDGNGAGLFPSGYSAMSSDPAVASIGVGTGGIIAVVGQAEGTATITVTRNVDGATASLEATVTLPETPEPLPGFTIQLGPPVNR